MPIDSHSIPGLYVGDRLQNQQTRPAAYVPEDVIDKHLLIAGKSGAGKSTTATQAIRTGHATTDGATIIMDPKGDGWPTVIGRALYWDRCVMGPRSPSDVFDDVYYFDANFGLPRLPLFDLRPALEAGVSRIDAAKTVSDDMVKMVELLLPAADDAVRAPDVITTLVLALFDPKHGDDAYGISDLHAAASELSTLRSTPDVSSEWLQRMLDATTDGSERVFSAIQQGVKTRLIKLLQDPYLHSMFDSVDDGGIHLANMLDEDVVIIFDISSLSRRARRVVARTVIRRLWRAIEWRQESLSPGETPSQVTLWIDEAAELQLQEALSNMLAMGRGFGLGVIPMVQFPKQVRESGGGDSVYDEVLQNVESVLCGHLDDASALAEKLSTSKMSPHEVAARIRNCPADRWLFSPAAGRSQKSTEPPLMKLRDPSLPPGHPDGPAPLSAAEQDTFETMWEECRRRTIEEYGVTPTGYDASSITSSNDTPDDKQIERGLKHTLWLADVTLPDGVGYESETDQLQCTDCGEVFLPTFTRLKEAVSHCHPDRTVSSDDLPITDIGLTEATSESVQKAPVSLREIMFLRLVERAERREFDPLEWDIRDESMVPLRNTLDLDADDEETLIEKGYLTQQPDFRTTFYRLTKAGRKLLTDVRNGADPPRQQLGDPNESAAHIRLVEVTATVLGELAADPTTPIDYVERYWSPPEQQTVIDVAAFDETGTPRIVVEAERRTHDLRDGAPADYDVLASIESAVALWVVTDRATGHRVVDALIDPDHGTNRLDMTLSDVAADSTALSRYDFSSDGCANLVTVSQVDRSVILDMLE